MAIFRGIAIYLALAGIILAVILIKILKTPDPELIPIEAPTVNPYVYTLAASGIVEAVDKNIAIGVPQSGLVKEIYVKVWNQVVKDQPLFLLDDRELLAQLLVHKANIKVQEATLNRLQDQLKRLQAIHDKRAISQEEISTRQNDVHVADAQLAAAQAQAQQIELLIERLTIRAPGNGIILQNNIRPGEYISSVSIFPAMILGNLDHLQVRADIDEQNASYVVPHVPATAFPKNNTQMVIPLYFDRIEPYVIPKQSLTGASNERVDTRVLQVIYSFEKPLDFPLYVGQQVDVFIEHPQHEESKTVAFEQAN